MLLFVSGKYGGFRAMLPLIRACAERTEVRMLFTDQHMGAAGTEQQATLDECLDLLPQSIPVHRCHSKQMLPWIMSTLEEPCAVVVYGDRMEALLAAAWGHEHRVPVMHLQAGDISGGVDDGYRMAIAHLATEHFAPDKEAEERLWLLGVDRGAIHVVGDHHVDGVLSVAQRPAPRREKLIVCHLHPDTLADEGDNTYIARFLWVALTQLQSKGYYIICLPPCSDRLRETVLPPKCFDVRAHIPLEEYVLLLQRAALFVGNSSTAIIECPVLGTPAVTVGGRQRGRDDDIWVSANKELADTLLGVIEAGPPTPVFPRGRGDAWEKTLTVFEKKGLLDD